MKKINISRDFLNKGPAVENQILNVLKNREDLKKWLLATSDYGEEIQEDLNAIKNSRMQSKDML